MIQTRSKFGFSVYKILARVCQKTRTQPPSDLELYHLKVAISDLNYKVFTNIVHKNALSHPCFIQPLKPAQNIANDTKLLSISRVRDIFIFLFHKNLCCLFLLCLYIRSTMFTTSTVKYCMKSIKIYPEKS